MSRLYPKSFLRLILIGFGLVSLPLVFALGNAAFNVQHLAEQSERAVREAAVATRASREMLETLTGMERALRQYQVLRERGLLEDYRRLRGEFVQATQEYSRLPLDEGGRAKLASAGTQQKLPGTGGRRAVSPEEFSAIAEQARACWPRGRLIDVEVEGLRTTALDARSTLTWQLFAAIPVMLGIALWFRAIIPASCSR